MKLETLFPKETKLRFEELDRDFTVKPITLADDAWMSNEFGGQVGLKDIFLNSDVRAMVRIFYRLITNEDKDFVSTISLNTIDEDGVHTPIKSGVDKLMYFMNISNIEELIRALMDARGISMPPPTVELEDKKKVMNPKKK